MKKVGLVGAEVKMNAWSMMLKRNRARPLYNDYLASEEWRIKRFTVLERDGFLCQKCLVRHATQVHHLSYDRVGDEALDDLVSLCGGCHTKIHLRKGHTSGVVV